MAAEANQAVPSRACPLRPPAHLPPHVLQPCGGAIPICMVEEFDLPMEIIDRRVTKMKMISPSNREVDVGKTLNDKEWIGMCRREVRPRPGRGACAACPLPALLLILWPPLSAPSSFPLSSRHSLPPCPCPPQVFDDFLRKRAAKLGANVINGLYMGMEQQGDGPITLRYNKYNEGEHLQGRGVLLLPWVVLCCAACAALRCRMRRPALRCPPCRPGLAAAAAASCEPAARHRARQHQPASSAAGPLARLPRVDRSSCRRSLPGAAAVHAPTLRACRRPPALPRRRQGGHPQHAGGGCGDWRRRRQQPRGQGH